MEAPILSPTPSQNPEYSGSHTRPPCPMPNSASPPAATTSPSPALQPRNPARQYLWSSSPAQLSPAPLSRHGRSTKPRDPACGINDAPFIPQPRACPACREVIQVHEVSNQDHINPAVLSFSPKHTAHLATVSLRFDADTIVRGRYALIEDDEFQRRLFGRFLADGLGCRYEWSRELERGHVEENRIHAGNGDGDGVEVVEVGFVGPHRRGIGSGFAAGLRRSAYGFA